MPSSTPFQKFEEVLLLPSGASTPPAGVTPARRPLPVEVLGSREVPDGTVYHVPGEVFARYLVRKADPTPEDVAAEVERAREATAGTAYADRVEDLAAELRLPPIATSTIHQTKTSQEPTP